MSAQVSFWIALLVASSGAVSSQQLGERFSDGEL